MLNKNTEYLIKKLSLQKHPEGGYFIESYRSERLVTMPDYNGPRNTCTAIYYLLEGDQFSSFHTLKSDEIWHFYAGSSLTLHIIETDGRLNEIILGSDIHSKETFQVVVKAGAWFAASVNDHNSYSLVGCTVSPGFDYRDWKLVGMDILIKKFPQHKSIIEKYTEH
jgi:predicted cupin superfamily sugar epimerase